MSKARAAKTENEEVAAEDLDKAIDELRDVLHEQPGDASGEPAWPSADVAASFEAAQPAAASNGQDTGDEEVGTGLIMNIPVDVQIVLGSAEMQVSELMSLKKGATVALNRRIGEPVDVVVNGRRVARGEITVLDNDPSRFGIRLTEIIGGSRAA
ncbi:flagellar motor switch protein FliN [Mesorhizobium xinjiangense]|uniref:flagellar motor switch protein FliN n=1 Tax=Mesorhizobium xinjiangense TaxID=2678685 RepID=UPI0012EE1DBE|nr:flagellar motor switch protein FliN [Mesorhizobium xinjiangense]